MELRAPCERDALWRAEVYLCGECRLLETHIHCERGPHAWMADNVVHKNIAQYWPICISLQKQSSLLSCSRHGGRLSSALTLCLSLVCVCAAFADFCRHLAEKIFGNFPIIDLDKSIIIRASLFSLLLHVRSAWRAASKNEPNWKVMQFTPCNLPHSANDMQADWNEPSVEWAILGREQRLAG
jgi:hypothetical protein